MNSPRFLRNKSDFVAKIFGYHPIVNGRNNITSYLYSIVLWILFCSSGVYMSINNYKRTQNILTEYNMVMKVMFIKVLFEFIVSVISTGIAAHKSRQFFGLLDKFYRFDMLASRKQCSPNTVSQTFYMLYVLFIAFYNFITTIFYMDVNLYILLTWHIFCTSTMFVIVQYVSYVTMLQERYKSANIIFTNSILKNSSPDIKYIYPKEINSLFIELRDLTEEVKSCYACHTIIIIIESVLILVLDVTTLTINHLNELEIKFIHNEYFIGQCSLRLLFLFFVVRETHNAVLEANNTVSIGHEALHIITDTTTARYLEIIILNCWNHPIIFDVHDFFDMDYKLLQGIIASVVTYVVVLVQIQFANMEI